MCGRHLGAQLQPLSGTPASAALAQAARTARGRGRRLAVRSLAVLLFTHASKDAIDTWALYAGSVCAVYTAAKSLKPNDEPKPGVEITRTETAEAGSEVAK